VTLRISSIGWRGDTGFGGTAIVGGTATSLDFIALEDQMNNARGSAQQFYNAPIGSNNRVLSAQIDTSGLFVSGAFTSSLSQGHIWVGGTGNVTRLVPTASFASTGSNTFIGNQTISGSLIVSGALRTNIISGGLNVNGGITGSLQGNVAGTATFAGTVLIGNASANQNYAMLFTTAGVNGYLSPSTDIAGGVLYNPSTNKLTISGSSETSGSQIITGSLLVSGSTFQTGNNTLIGNTVLSGSVNVSGSMNVNGNINILSGSDFYLAGNRMFNYGQWGSLETQTGSADTAYAMKFGTQFNGADGVYVGNNVSGLPTRIYVENTGLYNIQYSTQLHTTVNEACDFSIWLSMTGSNIDNSNTDYTVEKIGGGGFMVGALNFLASISSGSYVEIYWSKTTADGQLQAKGIQSTPTRPMTPSVIVTLTQIA